MKLTILILCLAAQFLVFACSRASPGEGKATTSVVPVGPVHVLPAAGGDVATLVRAALVEARRQHRRLLVYVGASFSTSCVAFKKAARHGELDHVLPGLTVLEFDSDHDLERLAAAGYDGRHLPVFVLPRADGRASPHLVVAAADDGKVGAVTGPLLRALLERDPRS